MSDVRLITEQDEHILRKQTIDPTQPGTILRDFQTLLEFVQTEQPEAGGKHALLPMRLFNDLNARMTRPFNVGLQRPQLRSFPNLQGLHLLLRATGLVIVKRADRGAARLFVDPAVLESWNALNSTERYFTLLETWLLRAQSETIGEPGDGLTQNGMMFECIQKWETIPRGGLKVPCTPNDRSWVIYKPYQAALMYLFGLIVIEQASVKKNQPWTPTRILRLPFGDALFSLLKVHVFGIDSLALRDVLSPFLSALLGDGPDDDGDEDACDVDDDDDFDEDADLVDIDGNGDNEIDEQDDDEEDFDEEPTLNEPDADEAGLVEGGRFGHYQPLLQPYFPEWRNNLIWPIFAFRDGIFIVKVSLGKAWRRIAIPGGMTLEDLADTILDAYRFDWDHLYEFQLHDRGGAMLRISHPYTNESPCVSHFRVGRLPMDIGDSMTFTYDFGDNWEFDVLLERIDPSNAKPKRKLPAVLEQFGKSPKQYQDYDDDE